MPDSQHKAADAVDVARRLREITPKIPISGVISILCGRCRGLLGVLVGYDVECHRRLVQTCPNPECRFRNYWRCPHVAIDNSVRGTQNSA